MKKDLWLVEDELRVATGNFLDVDAKLKTVKGQLISRRHFVFSILPKNERKISAPLG